MGWVSFSIPMRAGEISSVVGVLFGVTGIVFDTRVGEVTPYWGRVSFSIPVFAWGAFPLGWCSPSCGVGYRFRYLRGGGGLLSEGNKEKQTLRRVFLRRVCLLSGLRA